MFPRLILRINYLAFILLWLTIVSAAPISQSETNQNGALEPRSNLNLETPKQILPRYAPLVATKDGPPNSSKIAAVKEPGEKPGNLPQPSNDSSASKDGSPPQRQNGGSTVEKSTPGQDSKPDPAQGQFSQGNELAVGRVPKNSNSSPPAGRKDQPPQNQPAQTNNPPPAQDQAKPAPKEKEKPKVIYIPMPKIQLFGRPHEGHQEYIGE
jgi:hypothetical protein